MEQDQSRTFRGWEPREFRGLREFESPTRFMSILTDLMFSQSLVYPEPQTMEEAARNCGQVQSNGLTIRRWSFAHEFEDCLARYPGKNYYHSHHLHTTDPIQTGKDPEKFLCCLCGKVFEIVKQTDPKDYPALEEEGLI